MRLPARIEFLLLPLFLLCFISKEGKGQTLGGRAAYNFLQLPPAPLQAAAGGLNVSYAAGEVGSTAGNPALLNAAVSKQLNASFHNTLAGTRGYSLTGALNAEKLAATVGGHVTFLDYGSLPNTDAAGNTLGQFHPVDFVVQASAAKKYLQNWNYGATVKFIRSSYGIFRSSAIAADIGVLFRDSVRQFAASVVVKNMGVQLKSYTGEQEELPFDLLAGFTKRLAKAPLGFSLTAQHLQTFDVLYNDTTFNRGNNIGVSSSAFTKLLTHLVLASHFYLGQNIEATLGYNFLRRQQLAAGTEGSGLAGFSGGLRIRFAKLQVLYARSSYQKGVATNQIGLTVHLDRVLGLGQ